MQRIRFKFPLLKKTTDAKHRPQYRSNVRLFHDLAVPFLTTVVPEVKIHADGGIKTFEKWNAHYEDVMDAGLIQAQNKRFRRLWRIFICLDSTIYDGLSLGMLDYLNTVIREAVFEMTEGLLTKMEVAYKLAQQGTTIQGGPFFGKPIKPLKMAAQQITERPTYPLGTPRLSNFF